MNFLIVLGSKLLSNGNMPQILINRLKKVCELYNTGKYDHIIVSGGQVEKKTIYTEAHEMKRYLIDQRIPVNKIIIEDISKNTTENAKECLKIINKLPPKKLTIITSFFHLKRVQNIFNDYFKHFEIEYIPSENGISGAILKDHIFQEKKYLNEYLSQK